ncbi:hypothetical protein, partial [Vibrio coralliirubri]|uniref:hypothetical protein n=1 Tax=Vibrio coralliirubri TaxID=1516159 RepID=UPI001E3CDF10
NLSTPAIYEASAEMLGLFCICCFYEAMLGAGSPARSNLYNPAIFKALAEMLEPFCFLNLIYGISKAADSPTYKTARVGSRNL